MSCLGIIEYILFSPQNVVVVDTIRKELLLTSGIPDSCMGSSTADH